MSRTADRFVIKQVKVLGEWRWEAERCIVCLLPIKPGEKTIFCPYCGSQAHRIELLEWVKTKGNCPFCKRKLSMRHLMVK